MASLDEPPSSEKAAEQHSTTQLEASHSLATPEEETAGKQPTTVLEYHMDVKKGETKLLSAPWNKTVDTIQVAFSAPIVQVTKREILRNISKIYDHLGVASPVTLAGKMLYRETYDARVPLDRDLPRKLKNTWENWERMLTGEVEVPRSLLECREEILSTVFPAFGDASSKGNSAAVYAVTHQSSGITQGLVTSKSRLAKKGLTTRRLELVTGHMATNLVDNVKEALQGFPTRRV